MKYIITLFPITSIKFYVASLHLVVIILFCFFIIPNRVSASTVDGVNWKNISPSQNSTKNYKNYGQNLYSYKDTIYLSSFEGLRGSRPIGVFSKYNKGRNWKDILKAKDAFTTEITNEHNQDGLYFNFSSTLFHINKGSVLTIISCGRGIVIDEQLFTSCNGQIRRRSILNHDEMSFPLSDFRIIRMFSTIKFNDIYYLYGSDYSDYQAAKLIRFNPSSYEIEWIDTSVFEREFIGGKALTVNDKVFMFNMRNLYAMDANENIEKVYRFASEPLEIWATNGYLYILQYSNKDHQYYIRYSEDGSSWSRLVIDGYRLKDARYIAEGNFYLSGKPDGSKELAILHSNDGLNWNQYGERTFKSIADIEFTDNALYVVTKNTEVYKSKF